MARGVTVVAPIESREQRNRISKVALSFAEPLFALVVDTGAENVVCEAPEAELVLISVTGWMKFVGKGENVLAWITACVTEAEAGVAPEDLDCPPSPPI